METNELYVIFLTYDTTETPIWFHPFPSSQLKVRDTIHYTVQWSPARLATFKTIENLKHIKMAERQCLDCPDIRPCNLYRSVKPEYNANVGRWRDGHFIS